MRGSKPYFFVLFVIAAYAGYFFYTQKGPCEVPLTYKLGTFDTTFGISQSEFRDAAAQAARIWNDAAGKVVLRYDPKGSIPVNLIYDTRQQLTERNQALTSAIQENKNIAASVKAQFTALEVAYTIKKQTYNAEVAAYTQHVSDYQSEVNYWNSRGGAPQTEFAKLSATKNALGVKRATLEATQSSVNDLATQINGLIDKYNVLADHIEANVNVVNRTAGKEFEEGDYVQDAHGESIHIYEFSNKIKLVRVLAHEFGHALGLQHNANPKSIMFAVNESWSLVPTKEDILALYAVCGLR